MSPELQPLSPEVRALLEHEREVPPLPPSVRTRVATRARVSLRAAVATRAPVRAGWRRWALAASLICLISTGVSAAVLELRAHVFSGKGEPTPAAVQPAKLQTAPMSPRRATVAAPVTSPEPPVTAPTVEASARVPADDAARAELRLLRQARAAVTRADYAGALRVVNEHTRRFRNGRLTEEREALRVKSLAELGRSEEARRAASAFQARFPRSVLAEAVNKMAAATP